MRRHLLNIAASLSLVLCAAIVMLWVRSYWVGDFITVSHFVRPSVPEDQVFAPTNFYKCLDIRIGRGRIDIEWDPNGASDPREPLVSHASVMPFDLILPNSSLWERIGILSQPETAGHTREFLTSFWTLAIIIAVPAGVAETAAQSFAQLL